MKTYNVKIRPLLYEHDFPSKEIQVTCKRIDPAKIIKQEYDLPIISVTKDCVYRKDMVKALVRASYTTFEVVARKVNLVDNGLSRKGEFL